MPSSLTPFAFGEHLVRSITDENGDPWFVAKDVALALGYQWNGSSRIAHVPDEWKRVTSVVTLRGDAQDMPLLSEQGLYFFLGRSDKPRALPFQKWLAGEVLPTLRKSGTYRLPGEHRAVTRSMVPPLEDLPADVLDLNRKLRARCLFYALQMARLTGQDSPEALRETFISCCRLVSGARELPCADADELARFLAETCERDESFRTGTQKLWLAFRLWAPETLGVDGKNLISLKAFAVRMRKLSGASVIRDKPSLLLGGLRLNEAWRKRISDQQ